ncbi:MAG: hypothetical protein U9Q67_02920 [Patescibacteria group bacterium]|nr:hypothetical protein [Patescibacteria group bacterium]
MTKLAELQERMKADGQQVPIDSEGGLVLLDSTIQALLARRRVSNVVQQEWHSPRYRGISPPILEIIQEFTLPRLGVDTGENDPYAKGNVPWSDGVTCVIDVGVFEPMNRILVQADNMQQESPLVFWGDWNKEKTKGTLIYHVQDISDIAAISDDVDRQATTTGIGSIAASAVVREEKRRLMENGQICVGFPHVHLSTFDPSLHGAFSIGDYPRAVKYSFSGTVGTSSQNHLIFGVLTRQPRAGEVHLGLYHYAGNRGRTYYKDSGDFITGRLEKLPGVFVLGEDDLVFQEASILGRKTKIQHVAHRVVGGGQEQWQVVGRSSASYRRWR